MARPACVGLLRHRGLGPIEREVRSLRASLAGAGAHDGSLSAALPGASQTSSNEQHASDEEYIAWAKLRELSA